MKPVNGRRLWRPRLTLFLLIVSAAVFAWQNPALYSTAIDAEESARFLETLRSRPLPTPLKEEIATAANGFMQNDDGKPFYMLNLMRFRSSIAPVNPPVQFEGTPTQANAIYEKHAIPLLLKYGGQPFYMSEVRDSNLITKVSSLDDWSRVLLIRYPNRRAFMQLITDADYANIAAYKVMSLEVVLTPTVADAIIPPLWVVVLLLSVVVYLCALVMGQPRVGLKGEQE